MSGQNLRLTRAKHNGCKNGMERREMLRVEIYARDGSSESVQVKVSRVLAHCERQSTVWRGDLGISPLWAEENLSFSIY